MYRQRRRLKITVNNRIPSFFYIFQQKKNGLTDREDVGMDGQARLKRCYEVFKDDFHNFRTGVGRQDMQSSDGF